MIGVNAAAVLLALATAAAGVEPARLHLDAEPPELRLSIADPSNRAWRVERSDDLGHWIPVAPVRVANTSLEVRLTAPVATAAGFYRAVSLEDPDLLSSPADFLDLTAHNYAEPSLPAHLLTPPILAQDNTPAGNATTDAGAFLGRVLFHDRRLSANHSISCSSCHQAEHGFSDPRRFSVGFDGGLTPRNSMGLTNSRYYLRGHYFWDERAATLEDQVLLPIQNEVEMGLDLEQLVERVAAAPFYPPLFEEAFGDTAVTAGRISLALAQFVRSIVSGESKYDVGRGSNFANFTPQENLGRRLFNGQVGGATCSVCHGSDNFVPGNPIHNNGLENPYLDPGLGGVTGRRQDEGKFKVPSLRNIALTAPYMHDGRFATLEEVVEFYDSGVVDHPNLSPPLREAPGPPGSPPPAPLRLNLSQAEKDALVAFLRTLTDTRVTSDPRFSDPFVDRVDLTQP